MTTQDLEAWTMRALADRDPTVQRNAAVLAHKRLPHSAELMAALAPLLAHPDPWVRRAAAESYVHLDPLGAEAPALAALHADPSALVALTASGWLLDPAHECAELKGQMRAVLRERDARTDGRGFATTLARWHQVLWHYSPNPRAALVNRPITEEQLERDAEELAAAFARMLEAQPVPAHINRLQVYAAPDDGSFQLELQGFVGSDHAWTSESYASLPALRALDDFKWGLHDDPWQWAYVAGPFALAVACALEPMSVCRQTMELKLATCLGCSGEQVRLGVLTPAGLRVD
jgi:hypothetical protein